MLSSIIDRCGYRLHKDIGAPNSGSDYTPFNTSSGQVGYVDTSTYELIRRAHMSITEVYGLSVEPSPDMDTYTEIAGNLVNYRQDTKNAAKIKYLQASYNRCIELLMMSDLPDSFFNKHHNKNRRIIMAQPTEVIEPEGNPL